MSRAYLILLLLSFVFASTLSLDTTKPASKPACFVRVKKDYIAIVSDSSMRQCVHPADNCTSLEVKIAPAGSIVPRGWSFAVNVSYADCIQETGWAELFVTTSDKLPNRVQAIAAGFIEGYLTQQRAYEFALNNIRTSWTNTSTPDVIPEPLLKWINANLEFIEANIKKYATEDPHDWWSQVQLLNDQVEGLSRGYKSIAPPTQKMHDLMMLYFNLGGDVEQIKKVVKEEEKPEWSNWRDMSRAEAFKRISTSRCSALVRLAPDLSDMWVSHTTWGTYNYMTRIYKHYNLKFTHPVSGPIPNQFISIATYPGEILSIDDYYTLHDTNMVVMETTNDILNDELYHLLTPQSVLYWHRCMVANRLATSGKHWVDLFTKYNSGTYNNQWIIVDFKLFTPGKLPQDNAVWIVEQIPMEFASEDVTPFVRKGYWPSYNRPYFKKFQTALGYDYFASKWGAQYSYEQCPRARIFKRDATKVASLEDMMHIMTYNDYTRDPISEGYAGNAISARFDLKGGPDDGSPVARWFFKGLHGGTDCKISSYTMMAKGESVCQAGPPHGDVPPFRWTGEWASKPHYGLPEVWDFDFVRFNNMSI